MKPVSRRWMADTSCDADKRYREYLRAAGSVKLLEKTFGMIAAGRQLAEAGVRHRQPDASDQEVRRRVFELMYARDFTPEQLREWERRLGLLDPEPAT
jgi:hypothetical protein